MLIVQDRSVHPQELETGVTWPQPTNDMDGIMCFSLFVPEVNSDLLGLTGVKEQQRGQLLLCRQSDHCQ